jgi:TetR/AcrR family transcriptional regulator
MAGPRKAPGMRKQEILQMLATLLENPSGEKITTALLASKMELSEAALYRHFASKAQMFEGLIVFIEETIFTLATQIKEENVENGQDALLQMVQMLLTFAEKNPGMARILIGEALVHEDERLGRRIDQLFDRLELTLKQATKPTGPLDTLPAVRANVLLAYVIGRWQLFVRSGFKKKPTANWSEQASLLFK